MLALPAMAVAPSTAEPGDDVEVDGLCSKEKLGPRSVEAPVDPAVREMAAERFVTETLPTPMRRWRTEGRRRATREGRGGERMRAAVEKETAAVLGLVRESGDPMALPPSCEGRFFSSFHG